MRTASLALAAVLASASLHAQAPPVETPAEPPAVQPIEPSPQPTPPTAESNPVIASAGADGFSIQSDDGDYKLQFRAYIHADARFYPGDDAGLATDQFLVRRARPILQGTIAKHFDFNFTPDFGGGTAVIQDAYVDVRYSPKARFRVGKTKVPFSIERLQSATAIPFVERSLVSTLAPNRDVGAGLFGDLDRGVFSYAVGLFGGALDGGSADLDTNDGKDVVARLFVSPFKKGDTALKDLGFGVAGTVGDQQGALPSYRSGGQLTIASYVTGSVADGRRTRLVPQLTLYSGPFGLMGEYARSDTFVKSASGERTEVTVQAWEATVSWVLTGEPASFTGVRPKNPLDPGGGHWGAFELGARVNAFEIEEDAFAAGLFDPARSAREAFAWGVAGIWHLNRHVKGVLTYERTTFTAGAPNGAGREAENALFFRTQLSF
jgi:phosphate-selective porin OprO/OprP